MAKDKNFKWMRAVTKEEAEQSLKHWNEWAKKPLSERMPKGKGVGEWIFNNSIDGFKKNNSQDNNFGEAWDNEWYKADYHSNYTKQTDIIQYENDYDLKDSLTPFAKQLDWKTPTEFPQTPKEISGTPLQDYLSRLPIGSVYCHNQFSDSIVIDSAMSEDLSHLSILSKVDIGVCNYALSEVTFENGYFINKSIRMFFTEEGAKKYFTISLGKKWNGGDVFEDYC